MRVAGGKLSIFIMVVPWGLASVSLLQLGCGTAFRRAVHVRDFHPMRGSGGGEFLLFFFC